VTNFCDYPPEAKKKAKIGGMSNPSLEAIVGLKPDIVVMTTDGTPGRSMTGSGACRLQHMYGQRERLPNCQGGSAIWLVRWELRKTVRNWRER